MENRIPIDDLFREKLAEGREPHNLSAWANMSRMLDGKNPYVDEEPRKKRRILPFLGLFLAISGLLTASYVATRQTKSQKPQTNQMIAFKGNNKGISQEPAAVSTQNQKMVLTDFETKTTENVENKQMSNEDASNQTTNDPKKLKTNSTNSYLSNQNVTEPIIETSSSSSNSTKKQKIKLKKQKEITTLISTEEKNLNPNTSVDASETTLAQNDEKVELNKSQSKNHKLAGTKKLKAIKEVKLDTINQFKVTEKSVRTRNGDVKQVSLDTTTLTPLVKETIVERFEEIKEEPILASKPIIAPEKSNPRLVKLTKDQENLANLTTSLERTDEENTKSNAVAILEKPNEDNSIHLELNQKKHKSFFQEMVAVAKTNFQKVAQSKYNPLSGRISTIPGMSAGVNATLINSKHNFGGFHIGLTDLIPLNDYLSILTEIKFLFRNNSGFTVNDIQTNVRDKYIDNATLASQNQVIYSHQTDSSIKRYNFKNFSSLELPIMLQATRNKASIYGGINLAYNFGLNVNTINSSYPTTRIDTLSKFEDFQFPANHSYQYKRDDFRSRFGMGYNIGASYSFNPNLYVDLRMSQTLWNNAQTESAKHISSSVFKVPYFHFSVGYRFKKYIPEN